LFAAVLFALFSPGVSAQSVPDEVRHRSDDLDVPYVPSDSRVLKAMFEMAEPTAGDFLIDLGSGDGRIVIEAARRFGLRGYGVDLNEGLVSIATQRAKSAGVADRVQFHVRDLFKTDIRQASILTMYLLPEIMLELRDRLWRDLRPGTRIVSHDYHMGEWRPDEARVVRIGTGDEDSVVYYWMVPARVAGIWEWTIEPAPGYANVPTDFTATLSQHFQNVTGAVEIFPGTAQIHDMRLSGDRIAFSVSGEVSERIVRHDFVGTVSAGRINGTVTLRGGVRSQTLPWSAIRTKVGD
jgi:hypothetical protein